MTTRTTNRRSFVASALAASLTAVPALASPDTAGAADDSSIHRGAAGWMAASRAPGEAARHAYVGLSVGPDGYALAHITALPNGRQPGKDLGGWREIVVAAGAGTAEVRGESAPESAEAFVRRVLAAVDEIAGVRV